MKRLLFAILLAGVAAALPAPKASAPPAITVIETTGVATPLDAALILRATLRYTPKSIAFLDPLSGEEGRSLLDSKKADVKIPITFATSSGKDSAAQPPVDSVPRITFERLMVRTERSERGEVALDLEGLFRGQAVVVERAGGPGVAKMFPALSPLPAAWKWLSVFLAFSLPWWPGGRIDRALIALGVGCAWGLLGMALQQECGATVPWVFSPLLVILAAIPPGLHKVQQREPAA